MPSIDESLDRVAETIRRHEQGPRADLLGLQLGRVRAPTGLGYHRYSPSFSFVATGRKRSVIGDYDQRWGREHFLITPVDLPVMAGVIETGPNGDFLSAVWRLDPIVVAEVTAAMARRPVRTEAEPPRLGTWTPELADAVARLVGLLDAPEDVAVLAPLLSREVVLRLLQTDQTPRLLAGAEAPLADVVVKATEALESDLSAPWSLDRLAAEVGASPSTLGKRFKQVTGMTPVQYLKRLRLGEARRRMVVLGQSAAQAATGVGYLSASHFSRDYRLAYDSSPAADAAEVRAMMRLAV